MPELSLKTFLPLAGGQNDIRRLSFRTEDVTYASVFEKIRAAYELQPGSFKILWKDGDGDTVTIANDEDFASMLRYGGDNLKLSLQRVAARPTQQPTPMEEASSGPSTSQPQAPPVDPDLHASVTCDGCNGQVRGIRYKCLVCRDFDLCAACEGNNVHNEHVMLKIPKPNTPIVKPIIFMAHILRSAEDATAQGKNYCHAAMGAMPNPHDFMDMNALGQQLQNVFAQMGMDASYFVQPPSGGRPAGCQSRCPASGCTCNACSASSAAASAALDRRITETLEHLRAMGFQDDNGSLTNLVRSKKGDLFAVLDILKAQQAQ